MIRPSKIIMKIFGSGETIAKVLYLIILKPL